MRKQYIDGPFGQIHVREWGEGGINPPLICLTPSPFSSEVYATLAPLLTEQRRVIAVDYPGYGNSDDTEHDAQISDYADVVSAVINALSPDRAVDLFGFHTGCLVAVETALSSPEHVRRLVLTDVPYFGESKRADFLKQMSKPFVIETELSMLEKAWDFCVAKRLEHIPLPRAYDVFIDYISPAENTNAAFKAAFQYDCDQRFAVVSHMTSVIATKSNLYESSVATAKTIPSASLHELMEVDVAVLEKGAPAVANKVNTLLSDQS